MKATFFLLLVVLFLATMLGPTAWSQDAEKVKSLTQQLRKGDGKADEGLVKQGAAAVPALVGVLQKSSRPEVDSQVISARGRIGRAAAPAVPALVETLKKAKYKAIQQTQVHIHTVIALGEIGPAAKEAAPALVEAIK